MSDCNENSEAAASRHADPRLTRPPKRRPAHPTPEACRDASLRDSQRTAHSTISNIGGPTTDFDTIFKAYDIRGIVGDQIDAEACSAIGSAFARHIRTGEASSVVIGHDMRPDSPELAAAFSAGASAAGTDITNIGLCATETLYFASGSLDMPGAMITASHNPAGYNGIKLCGAGAAPIGSDTGLAEIKALAQEPAPPARTPGAITTQDMLGKYAEHVLSFVDASALRPLKVVVDAANGMAGLVVPAVFESLPFKLDLLYPELDGTFPNHPANPLQHENLRDLQDRVLATSADIGLAFDGDADRVFAVDETAQPVSSSLITALLAREMLSREPGAVIVHNLICSASVPEVIAEHGGTPVRCRVGHSFVKKAMSSTGAVLGGEHSGHYCFRGNYNADSSMIAALLLLEVISREGSTLSHLVGPLQRYSASGEINTRAEDIEAVLERVADAFAGEEQDRLDGLTVRCSDWWFNIRPSNTEPLLRLNLEAASPTEVKTRVKQLKSLIT